MWVTMEVSPSTLKLIEEQYEEAVEALLDDPDEVTDDYTELAKYHHEMILMGKEIGTPFWEVARSDEYISTYKKILAEQGVNPEE